MFSVFSVRCATDRQSVASRPQKYISEVHFHGFVVLCFKMVVSNRVLSMVRVLAIIHILDGVSLIIFGIVDSECCPSVACINVVEIK